MKTLQITLKMESGTLTTFQADTIFGHLCWVIAHKEGEELEEFLKPFKQGNPPFIISDGFPGELLPKPLIADKFTFDKPEERKEWEKIEFLNFNDFNLIRKGEKCNLKTEDNLIKISSVTRNTVNRLTNTTLEEGGVYTLKEMNFSDITIYLKAISQEWRDRIVGLFKELSKSGFGRKKSIGKGNFLYITA
jgi:CRISPR-associated protein Csm4